jgi:hypothetical protein
MAARNASPLPAEPKPANRPRKQRKPADQPVTAVTYRKSDKDVAKLINCLAEWTRDLREARSAAPEGPARRSRSRSCRRVVSTVSLTPRYPRGNALTQSMEFTDRDGAVWLAYIESAQPVPAKQRRRASVLPDRHLRFDSATESRFTSLVPAGSPFLAEARLQSLLDGAQPDLSLALTTGSPARAHSDPGQRVIEWSTRAVGSCRGTIAGWSRGWQRAASRTEAMRRPVLELLSGTANTMYGMVEALLGHRPARP